MWKYNVFNGVYLDLCLQSVLKMSNSISDFYLIHSFAEVFGGRFSYFEFILLYKVLFGVGTFLALGCSLLFGECAFGKAERVRGISRKTFNKI